jgi:enoyl-CoA hydratase/carnithine racemase
MPNFANIIYEKKGRIAYVTINRPQRMNAIDPNTSRELREAFSDFRDDDDLWVSILTGAGEKAFSAGADLVAISQALAGGDASLFDIPFGGISRGFQTWKPMIAAINGYCLAGGLELSLCCDIRVAADHATFGLPEPTRAIIPGAGGTQRLPRTIPLSFAMEILLTGGHIDAQTALRWGLVSHVMPLPELMPKAEEIANAICECGPLAVRAIKQAAYVGLNTTLEEGLALELNLQADVLRTEDAHQGPLAFAQKRKPQYKGR